GPDGLRLGAVRVRATGGAPRAHVLFFHGTGNPLDREFDTVKRLANAGFEVLAFDYRGFGVSSDLAPSEAGIEIDSKTALRWYVDHGAPADRIVIYGRSF